MPHKRRHLIVDVETTGLSHTRGDRVIEVGAVAVENNAIVAEFGSLIRVNCQIHRAAQKIHGISQEMLDGQPPPGEVWPAFVKFAAGCPLVAHNAPFDVGFIHSELLHLGIKQFFPSVCTLSMSRRRFPKLPSHRLEHVAEHLLGELPPDTQLHRAIHDARLLSMIWIALTS